MPDDPNDELSEQLEDLAEEQESAPEEEDSFVEDTACRATILGCTVKRYADGRLAFHIKFLSRDPSPSRVGGNGDTATLEVSVPPAFEAGLLLGSAFDPSTLPETKGDRQHTMFRQNIANRNLDAWLQILVFNEGSLARSAGRDPATLNIVAKPQSMTDYAHNLHEMLQGVNCTLLQRSGRVWEVSPEGFYAKGDEHLKGYRVMWEE